MGTRHIDLPDDPEQEALRYIELRRCVRNTFEAFLRNLNAQSLRWMEQQFEKHGGHLSAGVFHKIISKVFPRPESTEFKCREEKDFIVDLAVVRLFESMDVDQSGEASWMEFVEYVCATAELLRMHLQENSGHNFDFTASSVLVPYRPTVTKCHFDKVFHWPDHPFEAAVVFEEGQTSFHLHRPQTMLRKRRVDGHRGEVLAGCFLPEPFEWVVTSGNDKTVCFWDGAFNLVKRWTLDRVIGAFCWCPEARALYHADHFRERIHAWHIPDGMTVRASTSALKPHKPFEFNVCHHKPVQAMCWMPLLQTLATASLDATVQLYDIVQLQRTHTFRGHSKGLTCLEYCPKNQMLLSSGFDNFIAMWDVGHESANPIHILNGHECSIVSICAVPETDFEFLSVDVDSVVKLWDVRKLACVQSFHASDRQAEKAGELEPLEPRTLCSLSRNRVVISGRRMVVFDRDASDPRVTADWSINAIVFNKTRLQIVTAVKNGLCVWCALTGVKLQTHDRVIEQNITALALGPGERRVFVGADDGEIIVLNISCGAALKRLTPHTQEVTQIVTIPGKVFTLSAAEKLINVHDDRDPKKAIVLKRIEVSNAGIVQMAHDGGEMIVGASEDGEILWYNCDFGKQVASSEGCEVKHNQAATCCKYFRDAPLIVTADTEGCIIFWSVPPLLMHNFFGKAILTLANPDPLQPGGAPEVGTVGITSLSLSWPVEDYLYVGTERGSLARVCIRPVVQSAVQQQAEILRRKASGEAAAVISGRIFDTMPKPCDSPEYVFPLQNEWVVWRAHRESIDKILVCRCHPHVILTLGRDACVRMWSPDKGESLGALEQGLPEVKAYPGKSRWRFPIDVQGQLKLDADAVEQVKAKNSEAEAASAGQKRMPDLVAGGRSPGQSGGSHGTLVRSQTVPDLEKGRHATRAHSSGAGLKHLQRRISTRGRIGEQWFAGPIASEDPDRLPRLKCSGLLRPDASQGKGVVQAACKLSRALKAAQS
mmetsp:Transcript_35904/g.78632  ORF Transcript_35904/g.78632 Transcript_35904/m.78632 type:complete len:995 (-) Transcript_35904:108-3092(-)